MGAADQWIIEARAYCAENLLLEGNHEQARREAFEILAENAQGVVEFRPLVLRTIGYAYLAESKVEEATAAFGEALELAQQADSDLDRGLALEAISKLPSSAGFETEQAGREAATIFHKLSMINRPMIPRIP
jgi:tetratricopeptide (TPR) repeat protein